MIDGLKSYPETKTTSLPWLQEIPAHWDLRRIKTLLREHDRRTKTGEERLLSLRMRDGIVDHLEAGGKPLNVTDLIGYKIVEPGMLIMNRMRASSGLFGVAPSRGLVSPDYAVFRPVAFADSNYLLHLFKMPDMGRVFRGESRGLGTGEAGFLRLYTDRFGAIGIPFPPLDEQRLIVRFLGAHSALMAGLIRAKQRIIKLLEEQKQAIIHRVVNRGLDPNPQMKASKYAWLGNVPGDWEVKPLKIWTRINTQTLPERTSGDFEFRYIDIGCVATGRLLHSPETLTFADAPSRARRILRKGDTILSTVRTYLKAILFIEDALDGVICSTGFAVMSPTDAIHPRYLGYVLQSPDFTDRVTSLSVGIAYPAISESVLGRIKLAIPSCKQEQAASVAKIEAEAAQPNRMMEAVNREIVLLRQFHTRLIADVVTGKLDVRAAASALPEITELEPIEEPTDGEDFEEALDDIEDEVVAA